MFSCPVPDQAQLCDTACDDEYLKCIEVICNNDFTDIECFGECMASFDNCEAKCPCKIGGECESGCPCPSYPCEPVCEDSDDLERSKVNSKSIDPERTGSKYGAKNIAV